MDGWMEGIDLNQSFGQQKTEDYLTMIGILLSKTTPLLAPRILRLPLRLAHCSFSHQHQSQIYHSTASAEGTPRAKDLITKLRVLDLMIGNPGLAIPSRSTTFL